MNYDYSKSGFGLSRRKKYMGYSKINEEIRYRPTSTLVRTIETIEASDLTQAQVEFSLVSIQLKYGSLQIHRLLNWIGVELLYR